MLNVPAHRRLRGFSLVEMMVAIVIGLLVSAGVINLIVAIDKANAETIESTRLTQELRTLAGVIADDLKRSRRMNDALAAVGQGTSVACPTAPNAPAEPCYPVTVSATCISYGYTTTNTASGVTNNPGIYHYNSIRQTTSGSVGSVVLDQLTFDPSTTTGALPSSTVITACPVTGATSTTLNSSQIDITAVTFTAVGTNEIDVSLTGKLIGGDSYLKSISRTFVQPIFIRSNKVN